MKTCTLYDTCTAWMRMNWEYNLWTTWACGCITRGLVADLSCHTKDLEFQLLKIREMQMQWTELICLFGTHEWVSRYLVHLLWQERRTSSIPCCWTGAVSLSVAVAPYFRNRHQFQIARTCEFRHWIPGAQERTFGILSAVAVVNRHVVEFKGSVTTTSVRPNHSSLTSEVAFVSRPSLELTFLKAASDSSNCHFSKPSGTRWAMPWWSVPLDMLFGRTRTIIALVIPTSRMNGLERIGTDCTWRVPRCATFGFSVLWFFRRCCRRFSASLGVWGLASPPVGRWLEQWTEAGKIRCNAPGHALWIKWAGNISGTMKQTARKYDEFMMNFWCSCSFLWVVLLFSLASWRETSGIARSLQAEQRLSEERLCPAPSPASAVSRQPSAVSSFQRCFQVLRLPFDYFSPNIALWNAANMVAWTVSWCLYIYIYILYNIYIIYTYIIYI